MEKREQDSLIAKQERAVRQQQLLEKKRQARAEYNTSDGSTARQEKKLEKRQEQHRRKERKAIRVQEKKQEKKKLRFMKSFQSAVAFDDAEGVSVSEYRLSGLFMYLFWHSVRRYIRQRKTLPEAIWYTDVLC